MKIVKNQIRTLASLAVVTACLNASALDLKQIASIDLAPLSDSVNFPSTFIGNIPSAMTWNGTDAWIGGRNESGANANTYVIKISSVLGTPTFGTPYGSFSTATSRGITSMDLSGNNLLVSLDNGAGSGDSVRLFDAASQTLTWRIGGATAGNDSTRRGNGSAFDPGYIAGGSPISAAAYLSIGSGRRHRLDTTTGVYLNGQSAGAVINFPTISTTWRDLDFDPATGDMYTRESNRVGKHTRTGDNTFSPNAILVALTTATAVDSENIAFMDVTGLGNFLIFNDRSIATPGQSFTGVIKASNTSGTSETINWNFGSFGTPGNGAGNYDFSWDPASAGLAVVDSNLRKLYIFVVPEPSVIALASLGALLLASRSLRRRSK